jgi:hypothetical protein
MLDSIEIDEPIPLPNVSSSVLTKVRFLIIVFPHLEYDNYP